MKRFLKKILLGITLPQEYICVTFEQMNNRMKFFLESAGHSLVDVTENHILLGYKPLLIGLTINEIAQNFFTNSPDVRVLHIGLSETEIIANLKMKCIVKKQLGADTFLILEGIKGQQYFTNFFRQWVQNLYYSFTAGKKKNIFLKGNLFTQVKIAYSYPRFIYLVSVGSNGLFNIFPSDLGGKIGENFFAISLRTDRKANHQVESAGCCLLSEMNSEACKETYLQGINHAKDPVRADLLKITLRAERSSVLKLPVPEKAAAYYELEKLSKFEFGLHTVHFFKIINYVRIADNYSTLAHIHRDYAEWRIKKAMNAPYFFR